MKSCITYMQGFDMRKNWLVALALVAAVSLGSHPLAAQFQTIGGFDRVTADFDRIFPATAQVEIIASGFAWSEGPVWRKEGGYLLFSDAPNNVINKWTEADSVSVFLRPAGWVWGPPEGRREHGSNGLLFDAQNRLLIADHGNGQIARLDETTWTKTTLADGYQGEGFHSPNDMVLHSNGSLYFTDPPYGLQAGLNSPLAELDYSGVYRLSPEGVVTLLTRDIPFPNGIGLSPDERTLYVSNTQGNATTPAVIMAYDVQPDGAIANGRVFFDPAPLRGQGRQGNPDGMAIDQSGNVYVTGPGGIVVVAPDGRHLGTVLTGRGSSNAEFGEDGSTLFITSGPNVLRVRGLNTKGLGY